MICKSSESQFDWSKKKLDKTSKMFWNPPRKKFDLPLVSTKKFLKKIR